MQVKKQQLEPDMEQWTCSKLGKEYNKAVCILSPCLFNLYAEYIMINATLKEPQVGIKTAGRNTNNLRYADDTTLMAESEEELKSLLMKVKRGEWKSWIKTQRFRKLKSGGIAQGQSIWLQKTKIMASDSITSWQIDGETVETVADFILGGSKWMQMVTSALKLKDTYSLEGKLWPT